MRRADPRTKKDAASRIVQLPQGTVKFEAVDEVRMTGEVTRALEPGRLRLGDSRSEKLKHGGMVRVGPPPQEAAKTAKLAEATAAATAKVAKAAEAAAAAARATLEAVVASGGVAAAPALPAASPFGSAERKASWADAMDDEEEEAEAEVSGK